MSQGGCSIFHNFSLCTAKYLGIFVTYEKYSFCDRGQAFCMIKKFIFNFGCRIDNDLGITLKFNYAAKGLVSQNNMMF
jgi:hypothetical protein